METIGLTSNRTASGIEGNVITSLSKKAFFLEMQGSSMQSSAETKESIFEGDLMLIEPESKPMFGDIILVDMEGKLTIRKYTLDGEAVILEAFNPPYGIIKFDVAKHNIIGVLVSLQRVKKRFFSVFHRLASIEEKSFPCLNYNITPSDRKELCSEINLNLKTQINKHLKQAEAMAIVMKDENFAKYNKETITNLSWAISEQIIVLISLFEQFWDKTKFDNQL